MCPDTLLITTLMNFQKVKQMALVGAFLRKLFPIDCKLIASKDNQALTVRNYCLMCVSCSCAGLKIDCIDLHSLATFRMLTQPTAYFDITV